MAVPVSGDTSIVLTHVEVRDFGCMMISGEQQRVRPSSNILAMLEESVKLFDAIEWNCCGLRTYGVA